jgi:hypothetical protein
MQNEKTQRNKTKHDETQNGVSHEQAVAAHVNLPVRLRRHNEREVGHEEELHFQRIHFARRHAANLRVCIN